MIITPVRRLWLVGALCACWTISPAQVIELRATLSPAQEVPATSSPASGSAIMLYDLSNNTFDLIVSIENMANPASASHVHEAPAGSNGSIETPLSATHGSTAVGDDIIYVIQGATR